MDLRSGLLGIAIASMVIGPAAAQNRVLMQPGGGASCGTWTSAKAEDPSHYAALTAWSWGYLSRAAYSYPTNGLGLLGNTEIKAVAAYIDQYCATRPLESYLRAVNDLERELAQRAGFNSVAFPK
jgi:hypothetical protein